MLDIRLVFENSVEPNNRYHVCAAESSRQWCSIASYEDLASARAYAVDKQERDPRRDVRLLDRGTGEELGY